MAQLVKANRAENIPVLSGHLVCKSPLFRPAFGNTRHLLMICRLLFPIQTFCFFLMHFVVHNPFKNFFKRFLFLPSFPFLNLIFFAYLCWLHLVHTGSSIISLSVLRHFDVVIITITCMKVSSFSTGSSRTLKAGYVMTLL